MDTPDKLVSISNLRIEFKQEGEWRPALNDVSMDIYENEIVGIVGESGSGKTLTALSIIQLLPEQNTKVSGSVFFYTKGSSYDMLSISESEKSELRGNAISMIFQEPMTSLNPVVKCGKQVEEALIVHAKDVKRNRKKEVLDLLAKVDLPDPERIYKSYAHELSGGQLQRVMIALALICKPNLLIADEPTTALDVTVQKTIIQLIKKLQVELKLSVIFISHDLNLVGQIADRIIVMRNGAIMEHGSCKDIFRSPKNEYTKALLASRPPLNKKLKYLPTVDSFLSDSKVLIEEFSEKEISLRLEQLRSKEPILEVKGIEKHFIVKNSIITSKQEIFKAVNGVSFSIYPGETMGLVGESGCGKSTLGKSILKLNTIENGEIIFNNDSVGKWTESQFRSKRKDIQIIFQDPYASLNPRMRVAEILMEPMQVNRIANSSKERKNKAIELLERVGLIEGHLYRYAHEFSGGQRQRICIARALALKPKLIICDESVSALDVSVQAQVLNLLIELREEFNMSYLFISHDLSVVKFISDRMMVMQNGKIVEMGPAEEIYNNPKTDYTKKLINAIPKPINY